MSNSFLSLMLDATLRVTQAFVIILVARYVGPVQSGVLAIGLSFQAIFQTFTLTGTDYFLVREIAKDKQISASYFMHISVMKLGLACGSWIILWLLVSFVFHYPPDTNRIILLLAFAILPEGIGETQRALFLAYERLEFPTAVSFAVNLGKLFLSYILLSQGKGIEAIALVLVISSFLILALNFFIIFGVLIKLGWSLQWNFFRILFPDLSAFAGMGIVRVLEYHAMILLLSSLSGENSVGIFSAAYILVLGVLMLSQAYASGALPLMSRLYAQSQLAQLTTFYHRSIEIILVVGFPIAVLFIGFAAPIIIGVYASNYHEAVQVFQVLSITIPLGLFFAAQMCIMIVANLQNLIVRMLWVSLIASTLLGTLLIAYYGALGAAMARLIATAIVALLTYFVVRTRVIKVGLIQLAGLPAFASVIMVGVIWTLGAENLWAAPLGLAVYLGTLGVFFLFSDEYRGFLLRILGKGYHPR